MSEEGHTVERLRGLEQVLDGIALRVGAMRSLVQQSASAEDITWRTAEFLRINGALLESALGKAKAKALSELLQALARAQARTRADALESLAILQHSVSHAQQLLLEPPGASGQAHPGEVSSGEVSP